MGIQTLLSMCVQNINAVSSPYDLVKEAQQRGEMKLLVDFYGFIFDLLLEKVISLARFDLQRFGLDQRWIGLFGGEYDLIDCLIQKMVHKFWACRIELVFFVDGDKGADLRQYPQKFDTWRKRFSEKEKVLRDVVDSFCGYQVHNNYYLDQLLFLPLRIEHQIVSSLHRNGADVIYCQGEADSEMMRYMQHDDKSFAILGNDSDFCVMKGVRFIPLHTDFFDLDQTFQRSWNQNMTLRSLKVKVITHEHVAQFLKLSSHAELVDVCILRGNDFSKPFVQNLECHGQNIVETAKMFRNLTDGKERMELESIDEVLEFMFSSEEFARTVEFCRRFYGAFDPLETEGASCSISDGLDRYIESRYSTGGLSSIALCLRNGIFWHKMIFEDMNMGKPGIERAMGSFRKILCGMLRVKEITELGRVTDINRFQSMKVPCPALPNLPALNEMDSIPLETRLNLFDHVMREQEEPIELYKQLTETRNHRFFDFMEKKDAFIAYSLNYLLCLDQNYNLGIKMTEFLALATMAFSGGSKPSLSTGAEVRRKPIKASERGMILGGSWFQNVARYTHYLSQFLLLNEEFPEPKDMYVGRYFVLYYHWILQGERGLVSRDIVERLWSIVQHNGILTATKRRAFGEYFSQFHPVDIPLSQVCPEDGTDQGELELAEDMAEFEEDCPAELLSGSQGLVQNPDICLKFSQAPSVMVYVRLI